MNERERGVREVGSLAYRSHEHSEHSSHAESHHARYDGLAETRLHQLVQLLSSVSRIILSSQGLSSERLGQVNSSVTDSLDVRVVCIILLRPSLRGAAAC